MSLSQGQSLVIGEKFVTSIELKKKKNSEKEEIGSD